MRIVVIAVLALVCSAWVPAAASAETEQTLVWLNTTVADFQRPPERDAFEKWGQLTVHFLDCHQALFSCVREDGRAGDIELVRLTLPDDSSCQP